MKRVIMSVESVLKVVRMDTLERFVKRHAKKDIMEKIVQVYVLLTVRPVDIQTDYALVKLGGCFLTVLLNVSCPLERIVSIRVVYIVSIRHATYSMEVAKVVVAMVALVNQWILHLQHFHQTSCQLLLEEQLAQS